MARTTSIERPHLGWFLLLDGSLAMLMVLALCPSASRRVRSKLPLPTDATLRAIVAGAAIVHAAEGVTAHRWARQRDLDARAWAIQTAVVGFPSLRLLAKHEAKNRATD